MVEVIQLRWDGSQLQIVSHEIVSQFLGLELNGSTPLASCPQDSGMLFPFGTTPDGMIAYRFDWDGKAWKPTRHGKPFTISAHRTRNVRPAAGRQLLSSNALPRR